MRRQATFTTTAFRRLGIGRFQHRRGRAINERKLHLIRGRVAQGASDTKATTLVYRAIKICLAVSGYLMGWRGGGVDKYYVD